MKLWSCAGLLLCMTTALYANMREVSFYCVKPATAAPVLDGDLNDPCWKNAMNYTSSYEYFKPNPGPGKLKNSFRMVYTQQGLYMGIIHYDNNIKNLRITVTERDDGELWRDDCTEIYFDSDAAGIGWRKFVVNAIGTMMDIWRIDGAVIRNDWNADGWEVKVKIGKNAWYVESFWPWETLGKRAKSGDIWTFCHVRYAWGTGNFIGTTSSPGGNYAATSNFGFLCFMEDGKQINMQELAAELNKKVTPPWCLALDQQVLYNMGKGVQKTTLNSMLADQQKKVQNIIKATQVPAKYKKESAALQNELKKMLQTIPPSVQLIRSLDEFARKAEQFQWKTALEKDFN